VSFSILIPARLASSRLPGKPLADIAGLPMIVRVARRVSGAGATRIAVATDSAEVVEVCRQHGLEVVLTRTDHESGSDRLAEACEHLGIDGDDIVVNVQGDEPLLPVDLPTAVARLLAQRSDCVAATAAHPITEVDEFANPNVVKVVLDASSTALYFSRAPIPWQRDGSRAGQPLLPTPAPLRHIGLYAYRASFLRRFPKTSVAPIESSEALEQLRILWHGHRMAVHVTDSAPAAGVDTPEDLQRVRAIFEQSPA